jgi:transcriptional activator of cad operon
MAVLECLARANGRVVDRQVFFDTIWPGGVVSDDVLTQCIVELRKAFGDSARHPRIIETIPKIGFRLIPAVVPCSIEKAITSGDDSEHLETLDNASPWKLTKRAVFFVAGITLTALLLGLYHTGIRDKPVNEPSPGTSSIAVLPFVDMTEDQNLGWYADSLSEGLINRLGQLEGLNVVSRTSSFQFRDRSLDLRSIGENLGVSHLLEGSVCEGKSQIRITAQLINAKSGFHVWSSQYDSLVTGGVDVQESIVKSVATALSIELQAKVTGSTFAGMEGIDIYKKLLVSKHFQRESIPYSTSQVHNRLTPDGDLVVLVTR